MHKIALVAWLGILGVVSTAEAKNLVVGKWAFKRLNNAHEALQEEKYGDAKDALDEMKERSSLNDHEQALMWQTYGYVYSALENYPAAVKAFKKCLTLDAMAEGAANNTLYSLGQLYFALEDYNRAIATLLDWFKRVENPSASAHYLLAMAYRQVQKSKQALGYARKAVDGVNDPAESWLQLLLALYYDLDQTSNMTRTLERLVNRYPKKKYWLQLSAVYSETKQDPKALAAMVLADKQGYLTEEQEMLNLARLYLNNEIPKHAAEVLERGLESGVLERKLDTLNLLSQAWVFARENEKALPILGEAADMSEDGDRYVLMAQLHFEQNEWQKTVDALNAALKKGQLKDLGNAQILLGMTYYNMKRYNEAVRAFEQVSDDAKTRRVARRWIKLVRGEQEQRAQLN